ncbi:Ribonuclease H2 subunit B [Pleurotus pulmonarius]
MSRVSILPVELAHMLPTPSNSDDEHFAFFRLPHPRTGLPSLFLPYAASLLEVQAVEPPNPRSWFIDQEVLSDGRLILMTPIDPTFLLLWVLRAAKPEAAGLLRPADDIFEEAIANLTQSTSEESRAAPAVSTEDLTRFVELDCTKRAMSRVCEVKEISDELTVYRYSQVKTIEFLRQKVATVLSSEEFEQNRTIIRGLAKNGLMEDGNEKLLEEGRLQASCDLVSQYISPELKAALLATYELSALDKHVKAIQETALASAAIDVNGGSDKGKKGTKAAEDKKRKSVKGSTGVEKLKKANTKGMSKISSFFAKS